MRVSKELREKMTALRTLERRIRANPAWWTFEREYPIRGFSGPGPYMIVGDQPSGRRAARTGYSSTAL